jgi:hypothetical protein
LNAAFELFEKSWLLFDGTEEGLNHLELHFSGWRKIVGGVPASLKLAFALRYKL